MSNGPPFRFSLKNLFLATTLIAVAVYLIYQKTIVLTLSLLAFLPTLTGIAIRRGGMWLSQPLRSWVAVSFVITFPILLLAGLSAVDVMDNCRYDVFAPWCLVAWMPQIVLMDRLIRDRP